MRAAEKNTIIKRQNNILEQLPSLISDMHCLMEVSFRLQSGRLSPATEREKTNIFLCLVIINNSIIDWSQMMFPVKTEALLVLLMSPSASAAKIHEKTIHFKLHASRNNQQSSLIGLTQISNKKSRRFIVRDSFYLFFYHFSFQIKRTILGPNKQKTNTGVMR